MSVSEIRMPYPFPWQNPVIGSDARFKILRKGRRSGGSRAAYQCVVEGHGHEYRHKGMLQGGLIIWVGPDYKQTDAIWREDVLPMFEGKKGFKVNNSDYRVEIKGGSGRLEVISARNIDAMRGRGPDGVVLDESAHWDLEYAWTNVVRFALGTKQGWAVLPSTTNRGKDGNSEERMPSYYNVLCSVVNNAPLPIGMERPYLDLEDWAEFHVPTESNPLLPATEVEKMYREAGGRESPTAQQELMALLLLGGSGLAFPEWGRHHIVNTRRYQPDGWRYYAAMDWGRRQGCYQLFGVDSDGYIEMIWEFYEQFRDMHARQAAITIMQASADLPIPEIIYYDNQMDQDTGVKGGMTLISEFQAGLNDAIPNPDYVPGMYAPAKSGARGKTYRQIKKNVMHRMLAYRDVKDEATGELMSWATPKFRVQSRCKAFIREMAALPVSEKDPEDVDTDAPDHGYDCAMFMLVGRAETPEKPKAITTYDHHSHERIGKRQRSLATDMQESYEQGGYASVGMGYGRPELWEGTILNADED